MAKTKDHVTEFYSEFQLSDGTEQQLEKYGDRANIYKQQFQKDIDNSMNNTIKAVTKEIDLAILQKKDIRGVIKTIRNVLAGRTQALQKFLDSSYVQMMKYMILWEYQDIGCSKYIYITEGGNCEICDNLDGQVFSISEARPGINFAPIHPNCDCAAGILDDNGNIVSLIGNENNNNFNDKEIEIIRNFVSAGIGFIPVIGDIKDIQEALTGIDLITGKKLSAGERALTALTIFIPVVNGKAVREAFGLVDDVADAVKGIKKAAKSLDDTTDAVKGVGKAADDVAKGAGKVNINSANFAQKTYSSKFSAEGQKIYSELAGKPITTVDDLTSALKNGTIKASDVPIDYIVRDGNTLILNTRSSQALTQAGIPRSQWNIVNRTGNSLFEEMLTGQLTNNGLTSAGTSTVKMSGGSK